MDINELIIEIYKYLDAVDFFRCYGCNPTYR